jgi:hypothetical protein
MIKTLREEEKKQETGTGQTTVQAISSSQGQAQVSGLAWTSFRLGRDTQ